MLHAVTVGHAVEDLVEAIEAAKPGESGEVPGERLGVARVHPERSVVVES